MDSPTATRLKYETLEMDHNEIDLKIGSLAVSGYKRGPHLLPPSVVQLLLTPVEHDIRIVLY